MEQAPVAAELFDRMADRMAEVENLAQPRLPLVPRDDLRLDRASALERGNQQLRIEFHQALGVSLEAFEELRVPDRCRLDDFCKSRRPLPHGQTAECRGVDPNQPGLVERADQVLTLRQVDRDLSPDARVDHRKNCRWYLYERHAAQIRGGREAGEIPDHATAECHDRSVAICAEAYQLVPQLRQLARTLGGVTIGYQHPMNPITHRSQ